MFANNTLLKCGRHVEEPGKHATLMYIHCLHSYLMFQVYIQQEYENSEEICVMVLRYMARMMILEFNDI